MKAYEVVQILQPEFVPAGTKVYEYTGHDFGLKRDHEMITQLEHINVSKDGKIPFMCIPRSAVIPVQE